MSEKLWSSYHEPAKSEGVYKEWRELTLPEWKAVSNQFGLAALAALQLYSIPLSADAVSRKYGGKSLMEFAQDFLSGPKNIPAQYAAQENRSPDGWTTVVVRNVSPTVEKFVRFSAEWPEEKRRTIFEVPAPPSTVPTQQEVAPAKSPSKPKIENDDWKKGLWDRPQS